MNQVTVTMSAEDARAVAAWRALMPFSLAEQDLLGTYQQNHDYAGAAQLVSSHAEVFSAVFNGTSWSAPQRAAAQIYKCADDRRQAVYQDAPCPPGRELANLSTQPSPVSVMPMTRP